MKKNKLEENILLIIVIRAIFLLLFSKFSITDLVLGILLGLLFILLYQKLNLKKYQLFKLILLIIFSLFSLFFLSKTTYYIKDNILKDFSYLIIFLSLLLLGILITKKGYHTFIKTMELSTYILITIFILSIGLLIPYINIHNFTGINYLVSPNFIDISLLILICFSAINYLNDYKINSKIYLVATFNIIFLKLLIISILSQTLENVFDYPYISIFKKISYFDFFERLEGFLSMQYLFDYLFLLVLFFLTCKILFIDFFKIKTKTSV